MSVAAIGYLRIEARDSAAWMEFATGVLGLMDATREDSEGARFLRMDRHPFRFMIEQGEQDRLRAIGLEYHSAATWQEACDALAQAGHSLTRGSAEQAARRCVTRFVTAKDPSGNTLSSTTDDGWITCHSTHRQALTALSPAMNLPATWDSATRYYPRPRSKPQLLFTPS